MAIKREAQFTQLFRHWVKAYPQQRSCAFELKQTTTDSLPFSDVQLHQLDALKAAKHGFFLYKAPDDSRGIKPFDMFYLYQAAAYVVIRYPKFFCLIDVDYFIAAKKYTARKSLTSAHARRIAMTVVDL